MKSENYDSEPTAIEAEPLELQIPMSEPSNFAPAPPATTSGLLRRLGLKSAAVAVDISAVVIAAAASYRRELPPPPERDPRIQVAAKAVGFLRGSPHWDQVKVGKVEGAARRWSDPYPAHHC